MYAALPAIVLAGRNLQPRLATSLVYICAFSMLPIL